MIADRASKAFWDRVSRWLGIAGLALGAWGFVYPKPYLLVMALLAITPIIGLAVARASRGAIEIADDEKSWSLGTFVIVPPLALVLRVLYDFPLVDGSRLLIYGAAIGVTWGLLYLWTRPRSSKPVRLFEVVAGWIGAISYGWALAAALNGLLPQPDPSRFKVLILDKHQSGGKSRSYYLKLPPFGPISDSQDWDVGKRAYERLMVGGEVCVYINPGALGEPWYFAAKCAPDGR